MEEVREGAARLLVPPGYSLKGPGSRSRLPFYNPVNRVARDISILLLRAEGRRTPVLRMLDGLAATGVMGIRAALEAPVAEVVFNDRNPAAAALIRENLNLNGLEARVESRDLRALLVEMVASWVEVDPFGPPTPFVDAALQGVHNGGVLSVTATDTAVLTGAYPSACLRRYGARPLRCPFSKEVGLRILLGYVTRSAARFDMGVEVLVAFSVEHFLRAHMRVRRGASRANDGLRRIGFIQWDAATGHRATVEEQPGGGTWAGPVWLGPLGEGGLLKGLVVAEGMHPLTSRLLGLLGEEVGLPPLFYSTDEVASLLKSPPPPRDRLIQHMVDAGIPTARTHFDPKGLRTEGTTAEVLRAVQTLAKATHVNQGAPPSRRSPSRRWPTS